MLFLMEKVPLSLVNPPPVPFELLYAMVELLIVTVPLTV